MSTREAGDHQGHWAGVLLPHLPKETLFSGPAGACNPLGSTIRRSLYSAGKGTRTPTALRPQRPQRCVSPISPFQRYSAGRGSRTPKCPKARILSPLCLPFHHPGKEGGQSTSLGKFTFSEEHHSVVNDRRYQLRLSGRFSADPRNEKGRLGCPGGLSSIRTCQVRLRSGRPAHDEALGQAQGRGKPRPTCFQARRATITGDFEPHLCLSQLDPKWVSSLSEYPSLPVCQELFSRSLTKEGWYLPPCNEVQRFGFLIPNETEKLHPTILVGGSSLFLSAKHLLTPISWPQSKLR